MQTVSTPWNTPSQSAQVVSEHTPSLQQAPVFSQQLQHAIKNQCPRSVTVCDVGAGRLNYVGDALIEKSGRGYE
jgi:hypothetical protein